MNKKKYIDEFNNIHYLDKELGRGGQGVVYTTKDADTAIKIALINEEPIRDKDEIKSFHQKVKRLIFKPLPHDIHIATPLTVLNNEAGYVMNLLDGMKEFSILFPSEVSKEEAKKINIPNFLKSLNEKNTRSAFYFAYYLKTGGLRKRLYTLSRLAITLNRLHIRGLIYFDISHNNIYINNDDIPLVYLIDADNIDYESINKSIIYTPNFEVPEIVKGTPNSLYSDIYAFGILSFLTLTTTHPFDGEANGEADWDSDENKERWELPWIEDSKDDSNKSKAGLRSTLTITDELNQLFHQLFEEGKKDKFQRPTLPIWIESLERSASATIKCSNCGMTYYEHNFHVCPYCASVKPKRLIATSYLYKDSKKFKERWRFVKEITRNTKSIELPIYLFKPLNLLKIDDSFLKIIFSKKTRIDLYFEKEDEEIYFETKTPMVNSRKRVGLKKLEDGIEVIVKETITILVEIEIKQ